MTRPAKKAMMIGLDAPIVERLYDYAVNGKLPNFRKCIENGVWGKNGMNPLPTVTPPNWTTLATGAWPATHGVTCFNVHVPGDPLDITHMGFDTEEVRAEYLWEAIERAGKKAIVLNWPTSWPPRLKEGWQVAGAGLAPNEWLNGHWAFGQGYQTLAGPLLFSTQRYRGSTPVELVPVRPGQEWPGLPAGRPALQAEVEVPFKRGREALAPVRWRIAVVDGEGRGYDRVIVAEGKDAGRVIAMLRVGEWSPRLVGEFEAESGTKKAAFRMKLVELAPDGTAFRLYVTMLAALDGFTYPAGIADELAALDALPAGASSSFAHRAAGWFGLDTMAELWDMYSDYLGDAARHLLKTKDWSLFAMHNHLPDYFYHAFSNEIDPAYADAETVREHEALELRLYQGIDRMVGKILEYADAETVVLFVSDHGAKPTGRLVRTARILADAGLLTFADDEGREKSAHRMSPGHDVREELGVLRRPEDPSLIDWSTTKAFAQRSVHVYVNLKGRDPQGIVDPADYEKVQEEIVDALLSYKDPETGRRPYALVLKKEDARFIGLWGENVGDVVYAVDANYLDQHAFHLPSARHGIGSLRSLFLMMGPNVKKGLTLERNVWIQDMVPTLCYLTGWPVPAQAEGAVVYQALEDPNR